MLPFDEIIAGYDPSAHIIDDFFQNKLAFVVLLNFPLTTLDQRLKDGPTWTRRQWAEARLAEGFSKRIPADVNLGIAEAERKPANTSRSTTSGCTTCSTTRDSACFPPKMRLLSHWNLRDEIKADYADSTRWPGQAAHDSAGDGAHRHPNHSRGGHQQPARRLESVHQRREAGGGEGFGHRAAPPAKPSNAREPDTRYATLLKNIPASRKADPYSPTAPTLIARRFDEDREIPEARVRAMLEQVLTSPLVPQVAKLIETRLGASARAVRHLVQRLRPGSQYTEAQLDEMVAKKYPTRRRPTSRTFPHLLMKLGFSPERAQVPGRPHRRRSGARLRPRDGRGDARGESRTCAHASEKSGMDYKGYNIAVHEMGHNVEQIFSLNDVDHTLLTGVPNTAFTEALAFVFQGHDLELLGLPAPDARSQAEKTLNDFWGTYEIAGVALVDMAVWHWMYDHPQATPKELNDATVQIAKNIWNQYYAPVFHKKDVVLLGIYSHMIDSFLYLPDYPIGHMIAFQIEEQMKKAGSIGPEFERMAKMGDVTPDLWMVHATGRPVGPEALLEATQAALTAVGSR